MNPIKRINLDIENLSLTAYDIYNEIGDSGRGGWYVAFEKETHKIRMGRKASADKMMYNPGYIRIGEYSKTTTYEDILGDLKDFRASLRRIAQWQGKIPSSLAKYADSWQETFNEDKT